MASDVAADRGLEEISEEEVVKAETAETDDTSQGTQEELPVDHVSEILRNQRRRYVLEYLQDVDEPVTLGELSGVLAARENDKPVEQVNSTERKRVYVGLYQCHLPKMDAMDVVSFNKQRGLIEPGGNLAPCDRYLDVSEDPVPWRRYYAGVAVLSCMAITLAVAVESPVAFPAVAFAVLLSVAGVFAVGVGNVGWVQNSDRPLPAPT